MATATAEKTKAWQDEDEEESIKGRDEVSFGPPIFKPKPGENDKFHSNWIRILPPRADAVDLLGRPNKKFYTWTRLHFINKRPVFCVAFLDRACPLCAVADKLRRDGKENAANELSSKHYALVNVVEYKVVKQGEEVLHVVPDDAKVLLWRVGNNTLTDLLNAIEEELPEGARAVSSPKKGHDVNVRRKGTTQKNTKYEIRILQEATPFNGGDFTLLEKMHDLPALNPVPDSETLARLAAGDTAALPTKGAWEDDDDDEPSKDAIDAAYREVPDDEEDAPPAKPPKEKKDKPAGRSADAEAAVQRLREALAKSAKDDEDDDDDDEDD